MKRTSFEQFRLDFGEFPPKGLKTNNFCDRNFTINTSFLQRMLSIPKTFFAYVPNIISRAKLHPQFKVIEEKWEYLKNYGTGKKGFIFYFELFITLIFIVLIVPFVFVFVVFKFLPVMLQTVLGHNLNRKGTFGHASSLVKNTMNINNSSKEIDIERTIAHEHIHIVQFDLIPIENTYGSYLPELSELYSEDIINDGIRYLSNRYELEVRLHEVIIKLYKEKKIIIKTLPDFQKYIWDLYEAIEKKEEKDRREVGYDIWYLCNNIKLTCLFNQVNKNLKINSEVQLDNLENDSILKVINELFSVCYGNLLEYYGDIEASKNFKSQISSLNLYNRVYKIPH